MKIEKNHASILLLIGLMIIVLLRTMKCYSLNKQIENMQTRNSIQQKIYEGFKIETYVNDIVDERYNRFKYSVNSTLCDSTTSLDAKKGKIRKLGKHFRDLIPDKGTVDSKLFISSEKKAEGESFLNTIEGLLEKNNASRQTYCTTWNNETSNETFIADFKSTGVVNNYRPEIVTDTLNNLNKKQEKNRVSFADNENFVVNPQATNSSFRTTDNTNLSVSGGKIQTNILCPGINIHKNVSINNLMDEFYYLKDHVKDLILANQSYEKAFVK